LVQVLLAGTLDVILIGVEAAAILQSTSAGKKEIVPGRNSGAKRYAPRDVGSQDYAAPHAGELLRYYEAMSGALGPMHWWPAKTPFEVIVGAILTQSTAWGNVERAIANLCAARMLTPAAILRVRTERLAGLVRPSGYFRQKAKKLKAFVRFLYAGYAGSLNRMFQTPTSELREKLLSVHGIGPETADSILLYAGNHPVFVVDAYTHRILGRHGITQGKPEYEKVRGMIENSIPRQPELFNEFHALIVNTGKNWCRKSAPRCAECPLRKLLPANSPFSPRAGILPEAALLSGSLA
jgi:endonuclease-3 related protein